MIEKSSWANAMINQDFICVATYSGYRMSRFDPQGKQLYLELDASHAEIGLAVRNALMASRFVLPAPRSDVVAHPEVTYDRDLYDYEKSAEFYESWIRYTMDRYGYKTKRKMFGSMSLCNLECTSGMISMVPTAHVKIEAWESLPKGEEIMVKMSAGDAEIGAALKAAFGKCLT